MTQEVNSKHLSSSLCVEFSGRGILLQFSPQRESDLRQQWVLEARAPYQGQASRITVCYLLDRKSTRLNSSHQIISYAVFCLKKKTRPTAERCEDDGDTQPQTRTRTDISC